MKVFAFLTFASRTTLETIPLDFTIVCSSLYYQPTDVYHFRKAKALLSPTTRMEDVFFALYKWLDNHPTEAVLVSMNHEGGTGTPDDSALYVKLYNILNSPLAKKYWVQTNGTVSLNVKTLRWYCSRTWVLVGNAWRGTR